MSGTNSTKCAALESNNDTSQSEIPNEVGSLDDKESQYLIDLTDPEFLKLGAAREDSIQALIDYCESSKRAMLTYQREYDGKLHAVLKQASSRLHSFS